MTPRFDLSRRHLLLGAAGALVGCNAPSPPQQRPARTAHGATSLPPPTTPSYAHTAYAESETCLVTAPNIEGPFYKAGAPERARLGRDHGQALLIEGVVRDGACRPVPHAWIDVWHADHEGAYDKAGFGHRGRLRADGDGRYRLETIVPGRYLNGPRYRPAHIHVKLSAPGFAPLTTQLYFPDDPYNEGDPFIVESLIMKVTKRPYRAARAQFDFALATRRG